MWASNLKGLDRAYLKQPMKIYKDQRAVLKTNYREQPGNEEGKHLDLPFLEKKG